MLRAGAKRNAGPGASASLRASPLPPPRYAPAIAAYASSNAAYAPANAASSPNRRMSTVAPCSSLSVATPNAA